MVLDGERLVAEDQDVVVAERGADLVQLRVRYFPRQVDVGDLRTQYGVSRSTERVR